MAHERLFDYPFDFQDYVERSLREFEDEDERKFAKAILQDGLLKIIKANEAKYQQLENRVASEIENESGKYVIRTTVVKREDYDPIHKTLFPILESDRYFLKITKNETWENLKEHLPLVTADVFIEASDRICLDLAEREAPFAGKLITDHGEISALFQLRPSERHRAEIKAMYERFHLNHVPWTTVNTAYLDKFFEVLLVEVEGEIPDEARVKGIDVAYGDAREFVREDMMPLWNVRKVTFDGSDFPMPCIDGVNYEHEFPMREFGIFNGFLIESNTEIVDIRFEVSKIVVVTPRETFNQWEAFCIVSETPSRSLGYIHPIVSNERKNSFIKNYMDKNAVGLQTKADLIRRLHEIDIEDYIHYDSHEIVEALALPSQPDNMNWFIQDELLDPGSRRILLLKFRAREPGNYLNDAMVRFAVSTVQADFSEYRLAGCLTGGDPDTESDDGNESAAAKNLRRAT